MQLNAIRLVSVFVAILFAIPWASEVAAQQVEEKSSFADCFSRIYRIGIDDQEAELLVDVGTAGFDSFGSPSLSPNGMMMVFDAAPAERLSVRYRDSRLVTLVLKGPETGKTFDIGYGLRPEWSPDGKLIAFTILGACPSGEVPGVYVTKPDGTNRRLLARHVVCPCWSPDSKTLLCTSEFSGTRKLVLIDVESADLKLALNGLTVEGFPAWEPSGDRIAVTIQFDKYRALSLVNLYSDIDSIEELVRTNAGKGDAAVVPETNEQISVELDCTRPKWSLDGREIVFRATSNDQLQMFRVESSGETPAKPIPNLKLYGADHGVWSEDGKSFYFASTLPMKKLPGLKNPKSPIANKTAQKSIFN